MTEMTKTHYNLHTIGNFSRNTVRHHTSGIFSWWKYKKMSKEKKLFKNRQILLEMQKSVINVRCDYCEMI